MNNDINNTERSLNQCDSLSPLSGPDTAPPQPICGGPKNPDLNWLEEATNKKTGLGDGTQCDPFKTGQIINDLENPQRNVLYRYAKSLHATDEAMMDLFRNIVVVDEDGKAHPVPIIWATQEKAVAAVVQDNVRKDNSLVVDRIRLPMLAISSTGVQLNLNRYTYHRALDYMRGFRTDGKPGFTINEKYERDTVFGVARGIPVDITYTMYAWTLYLEDMNQIIEQIMPKITPLAYIKVRGISWEVIARLDSVNNNINTEPGDQAIRVIKFQFNITVETYISQPIRRDKAILKTKVDFVDGITEEEISGVIGRIEESVKELEC